MDTADRRPSSVPLPPELAALDFDPFDTDHDDLVEDLGEHLVSLTRSEVALRRDLAQAARLIANAEVEYLAAENEHARRTWRERARLAESAAVSAAYELERVLADRRRSVRALSNERSTDAHR